MSAPPAQIASAQRLRRLRRRWLAPWIAPLALARLRRQARSYQGRPALVVGSAPEPGPLPAGLAQESVAITINGAFLSAQALGVSDVHLAILSEVVLLNQGANDRMTHARLPELQADLVVGLLVAHTCVAKGGWRAALPGVGRCHYLHRSARDRIVQRELGTDFNTAYATRVSNGIFAICLARFLAMRPIYVTGIDPGRDGLAYAQMGAARAHKDTDSAAIARMTRQGWPVHWL